MAAEPQVDRYYLLEHSGYLGMTGDGGSKAPAPIEVMILDRDYCHRVVWSSLWFWTRSRARNMGLANYTRGIDRWRERAGVVLAELNAADRAELA